MLNLCLTQILQMAIGFVVNFHAFRSKEEGMKCDLGTDVIYSSFIIYASYFLLFLTFFYNSYLRSSEKKQVWNRLTRSVVLLSVQHFRTVPTSKAWKKVSYESINSSNRNTPSALEQTHVFVHCIPINGEISVSTSSSNFPWHWNA